jgi:hypothetical protein
MRYEVMHGENGYGIYVAGNPVSACIALLRDMAEKNEEIGTGPFLVNELEDWHDFTVDMATVVGIMYLSNNVPIISKQHKENKA